MKYQKATNILFIVSAIFMIITALTVIGAGIAMFVITNLPNAKEIIIEALNNGTIRSDLPGTAAEQADAILAMFKIIGIVCLIATILPIVTAILIFRAIKRPTQSLVIAVLVLSVLCGDVIAIVASVLALIDFSNAPASPKEIETPAESDSEQ